MERNQQNASKDFRTLTNHEYVIVDDTKGEFGASQVFKSIQLFASDESKKKLRNALFTGFPES